MDKVKAYNIIERIIKNIILPEYPELTFVKIDDHTNSFGTTKRIEFWVYFKSKKKLSSEEQMLIDSELKMAFQMAGYYPKNPDGLDIKISTWFKLPYERNYSFLPSLDYEH